VEFHLPALAGENEMRNKEIIGGSMRSLIQGLLVFGLMLFLSVTVMAYTGTYPAGTGINGTVHDLGTSHNGMDYTANPPDQLSDGTQLNRICIFCHAPHNTYRLSSATGGAGPQAPSEFDYLPLWNHTLQADTNYSPYDNGNGPLTGDKASQAMQTFDKIGNTSLLCLSCHDGSVAVNSYGNSAQISISTGDYPDKSLQNTSYIIGQDKYLGNHHPIGFNYDGVQQQDTEIRTSDYLMTTDGNGGGTYISDHLYNGSMECGTCHSVHNTGNSGEHLLWRSDQNSELCLTCHAKGIYTPPTLPQQ
jgi:predicted CXXCH cytochrome family protein